jgi:hypothetical protein
VTKFLKDLPALQYAVWDLAAAFKRHGLLETARKVINAASSPFFEMQYRKTHASKEAFEMYDEIALGRVPILIALEMIGEAMNERGLTSQAKRIANELSKTSVELAVGLFSKICMNLIKLGEFNEARRIIAEDPPSPEVTRKVAHFLLNQFMEDEQYDVAFELFQQFSSCLHQETLNGYLSRLAEEFAAQNQLAEVCAAARISDNADFILLCAIERLVKKGAFPEVIELSKLFSGVSPYCYAKVATSLPEKELRDFVPILIQLEKDHDRVPGAYLRVIAKKFVKDHLMLAKWIAMEEPDLETRAWVGLAIIDELIRLDRQGEVAGFIVDAFATSSGLISIDTLNLILKKGRYKPLAVKDPVLETLNSMNRARVHPQANAGQDEAAYEVPEKRARISLN